MIRQRFLLRRAKADDDVRRDRLCLLALLSSVVCLGCSSTPKQIAEAERVLADAKSAAAVTLAKVHEDAEGIREKAKSDAEATRRTALEEAAEFRVEAKVEAARIVDQAKASAADVAKAESASILSDTNAKAAAARSAAEAEVIRIRETASRSAASLVGAVRNAIIRVVPESSKTTILDAVSAEHERVLSEFATVLPVVQQELRRVRGEIRGSKAESSKLASGLLKTLIDAKVHTQGLTASLLEQRIAALESGTPVSTVLETTSPDVERAQVLEQEMVVAKAEIADAEKESARYSGGLVKAMVETRAATAAVTLAMLEQSYLHAKYGLSVPPLRAGSESAGMIESELEETTRGVVATGPITVQIVDKEFQESDFRRGLGSDQVTFSLLFTNALDKDVRAFTGAVVFSDLFDREIIRVSLTSNDGVRSEGSTTWTGGIDYNMFKDAHQRLRNTEKKDLKVLFLLDKVIYPDGTAQQFSE